ncbi:hypothetical protein SPURM210S_05613 [Streptomyces purpurascens]
MRTRISRAAEFAAADVLSQSRARHGHPAPTCRRSSSPPRQDVAGRRHLLPRLGPRLRRRPAAPSHPSLRRPSGSSRAKLALGRYPDELLPLACASAWRSTPRSQVTADELLDLLRDGDRARCPRPPIETPLRRPAARARRPRGGRRRVCPHRGSRDGRGRPYWPPPPWSSPSPSPADSDPGLGRRPQRPARRLEVLPPPPPRRPPKVERLLGGADSALAGCAAVDTSLVCAGSGLMATRFDLAGGRNTWDRPVDPTPDGSCRPQRGRAPRHHQPRCTYAYEAEKDPVQLHGACLVASGTGKGLANRLTGTRRDQASLPDSTQDAATAHPRGCGVALLRLRGWPITPCSTPKTVVRWGTNRSRTAPTRPTCARRPSRTSSSARSACREKGASRTTGLPDRPGSRKGPLDRRGQGRPVPARPARRTPRTRGHLLHGPRPKNPDRRLLARAHRATLAQPPEGRAGGSTSRAKAAASARSRRAPAGHCGESNSAVAAGPPTASAAHVYVASPRPPGRPGTASAGEVEATRPGRDDGGRTDSMLVTSGAPLVLVGDALYGPFARPLRLHGGRAGALLNPREIPLGTKPQTPENTSGPVPEEPGPSPVRAATEIKPA